VLFVDVIFHSVLFVVVVVMFDPVLFVDTVMFSSGLSWACVQAIKKNKKKNLQDVTKKIVESGQRYKSKNAGGDKLGNSKFEPFAYVRMDPSQLNKRSRHNSHEKYNAIIKPQGKKVLSIPSSSRGIQKPRTQRKAIKKHKPKK